MRQAAARDLFGHKIRRPPPPLERHTHIAIADLLRTDCNPDWWWTHIPSGELRTEATGALLKRMGLKDGMSDFLLISPHGVPHWLELKRGNLGQLSEAQEDFQNLCRRTRMPHAVARSFDEARFQLASWGVLRGRVRL